MIHLSIYNTSCGQKKGWESKCQFDSQSLKVENRLELHVCKSHVMYHWKTLDMGYKFALNLTLIESPHKKLWVSKMVGVLISRITT
jgi:hypothetical protein